MALVLFIIIALSFGVAGNRIDIIDESSNEYAAGIRSGDKIVSINGKNAYIWEDIYYEIINEDNKSYAVEIERNGETKQFNIDNNYRKLVGITLQL